MFAFCNNQRDRGYRW